MLLGVAGLCGCAAPATHPDGAPVALRPSPVAVAPPAATPEPAASTDATPRIDTSCRVDADCVVKDVGNCCGAYPACVNKDSPTDPAAVQAACKASGRMSVCGFREISACSCAQGSCKAQGASIVGRSGGRAPATVLWQ
ncbi:MAG: hypothetical protein ACREO8_14425 [Luteimonas sp.]